MVHANRSDTWLSVLLLQLYYRTPSSFPCLEHTCMHTHTHTHTHTHVHAYTHTHAHTCARACTHTCTYSHLAYADINRYYTRNDRFTQKPSSSSSSSPQNWPAVSATSWGLAATLCLTLRLQLQLLSQVGQLFLILLLGGWERREKSSRSDIRERKDKRYKLWMFHKQALLVHHVLYSMSLLVLLTQRACNQGLLLVLSSFISLV